jgi:hypothetical protein
MANSTNCASPSKLTQAVNALHLHFSGVEFEYQLKGSCDFSVLPCKHWDDTKNGTITTLLHIFPNTVFSNPPTISCYIA